MPSMKNYIHTEFESEFEKMCSLATTEVLAVLHEKIKRKIHLTIDIYTKNWAINKNVLYSSLESENVVE